MRTFSLVNYLGFVQAAVEYKAAFGIAKTGFSAAIAQFVGTTTASGGTAVAGSAAASVGIASATTAIAAAVTSHANKVASNTAQAFKDGSNYSSGSNPVDDFLSGAKETTSKKGIREILKKLEVGSGLQKNLIL